jgi:hypothetical protein
MIDDDIENRFTYHPPVDALQTEKFARIRAIAKNYAYAIKDLTPSSREQSLALTHLEEVVSWSNAAIARHVPPPHPFIRRDAYTLPIPENTV